MAERVFTDEELMWQNAISWLDGAVECEAALNEAILALALCEQGTTKLGRWEVELEGDWHFQRGDTFAYPRGTASWVLHLAPGAYLDGSAQELLLLMAAADELRRRMEAER